ncbi:MAG: SAM-dependent methyltransferase [Gammaproteobacteria bacterium]
MRRAAPDATSAIAFERLYQSAPDPWNFASSDYEQAKYAVTVAALSHTRYARAYEPGCSIGELTARLAPRCDRLLSTDIAPTAVVRARERFAGSPHVHVECADILDTPRSQTFDLIVLSEIGYYFDAQTLAALALRLEQVLEPVGEIVAVHWLGHSADHVLHGDEVHKILLDNLSLIHVQSERHTGFRLDTWWKI